MDRSLGMIPYTGTLLSSLTIEFSKEGTFTHYDCG